MTGNWPRPMALSRCSDPTFSNKPTTLLEPPSLALLSLIASTTGAEELTAITFSRLGATALCYWPYAQRL